MAEGMQIDTYYPDLVAGLKPNCTNAGNDVKNLYKLYN
jgi:hypothetical protein